MEVLYFKSQKISHGEIRRLVQISSRTLCAGQECAKREGDALKQLGWKGALVEHRDSLEEYFKKKLLLV